MFQMKGEVKEALEEGQPIVALESTVIAHGLPRPANVETALAVEGVVREGGAVPATIAILDGKARVGLSREEIERIGSGRDVLKVGTRDLPAVLASGGDGATTVSATAFIAGRAGIRVFCTGGIGGVHPAAGHALDVSADLWELSKTSIIVVSAGAKSILDLNATLEWLETYHVPVLGFRTEEFPGFHSRHSGLPVERVDSVEEIALRFAVQRSLGIQSAMLIAVPIPEEHDLDVSAEIARAVKDAADQGVRGKALTPWVLARLDETTGGRTVTANIALLKNNARVAAEIVRALSQGPPA